MKPFIYLIIAAGCYFSPLIGGSKENFDTQFIKIQSEELQEAIIRCVHTILPTEDYEIYEHKIPDDLAESGRAECIYFIFDKSHKPLLVVKSLSLDDVSERSDYIDEVHAIEQMKSLSLKKSHPVRALAFGEFNVGKEKRGFIAEEVANGNSINFMLTHYTQNKRYMDKAIVATAKAMAEIHKKKQFSSMNEEYKEIYDGAQATLDHKVTNKYPGPYGYIHGDMHPGNIFFDPKSGKIDLIDFSSHVLSRTGAPVALDPARFLVTFEFLAAYQNIPTQDILHYTSLFKKTYLNEFPLIDEDTLNLYSTLSLLEFNEMFSDAGADHKQAAFIYKYTSDKLNTTYVVS